MNPTIERLFSLEGRTALVTGASRGIGRAIAEALAQAGAATTGCGRSPLTGDASFRYVPCDVRDADSFAALAREVAGPEGRIDVLVNAAGITVPDEVAASPVSAFEGTIAVNLTAAYRCCVAVLPYMRPHRRGSIINITSIGAAQGFPGNPGYVAAKGGLHMMTKALALDCGPDHVRVNNIAPGYIHTAMTAGSYADPERRAARQARMMLPRWGTPEDVAGAALFLASDAAAYVTGVDLFVDGGWNARGL